MKMLTWNVRGLGDEDKNESLYKTIDESKADLICLQETKLINISQYKARQFLPAKFSEFKFQPSEGASAGLLDRKSVV